MKKRYVLILIASLFPLMGIAQVVPKKFDDLLKKVNNTSGITTVVINKEMLKIMAKEQKNDAFTGIDEIRCITADTYSSDLETNCKEIGTGLDLLTSVTHDDTRVKVYYKDIPKDKQGLKSELLVMVFGKDNAVIHIKGKINLSKMSSLQIAGVDVWK